MWQDNGKKGVIWELKVRNSHDTMSTNYPPVKYIMTKADVWTTKPAKGTKGAKNGFLSRLSHFSCLSWSGIPRNLTVWRIYGSHPSSAD
jgi:hypothetical protein